MVTTPASVPAAVTVLHLLEEDQMDAPLPLSMCLALHWEEPCCHGAEIIGYHIEYGEKQLVTVNRVTSHVLENLQPDTFYRWLEDAVMYINNIKPMPYVFDLNTIIFFLLMATSSFPGSEYRPSIVSEPDPSALPLKQRLSLYLRIPHTWNVSSSVTRALS